MPAPKLAPTRQADSKAFSIRDVCDQVPFACDVISELLVLCSQAHVRWTEGWNGPGRAELQQLNPPIQEPSNHAHR